MIENSLSLVNLQIHRDRVAVIDEDGGVWRYSELLDAAEAFASAIGSRRQLVLLEAKNDIRSIITLLGALRGRHPLIMAPPGDQVKTILDVYQPEVVVRADLGSSALGAIDRQPVEKCALHPELSVMLSTSGSTGSPKLVRLSLASLDANARSIASYLEMGSGSRAITSLPFSYSYGLSVVTSHLVAGGSLVLTSASVVDPEFRSLCERHEVNHLAGVPYSYELMERSGFIERLPQSIATLTQAGGRLPPERVLSVAEHITEQGARLFLMYGQTEATARMAYVPPALLQESPDAIGIPIPRGNFKLLDEEGLIIDSTGQVGELVYSGPNVMLGYANQRGDLAKGRELKELLTGDLAVRGVDGLYRIVGRKSRFVKLFGLRIGLDDVERQFQQRGIEVVATGDDTILAVIVPVGCNPQEEQEWLARRLKVPASAIDVAAGPVPRLSNGKVDFGAIRAAALARVGAGRNGSVQKDLVERLIASLFPQREISADDNFVTLGGDSLSYVQMSMGLEEILGYIPEDWELITIRELVKMPRRARGESGVFQLRPLETDILVRAAAIIAIVINHASNAIPVGGGANVLLLLFGLNFFRYSGRQLRQSVSLAPLRNFLSRIAIPYYILIFAFAVATEKIDLWTALLVSNFHGRFGNLLEPYWFIEVLAQLLILLTLMFAIGPVRRFSARDPWLFSLTFIGIAVAANLTAIQFFPRPNLADRTPEFLLWLVACGWALPLARSNGRKLLLFTIVCATAVANLFLLSEQPGAYLHSPVQVLWIVGGTLLLLWVRQLELPWFLRSPITRIAGASLQIYLVHNIVTHQFLFVWQVSSLPVILICSLGVGLALKEVQDAAGRHLAIAGIGSGGRKLRHPDQGSEALRDGSS